jgi:hypothetical protein
MKYTSKIILTILFLLFSYQIGSYYLDGKDCIYVSYYKFFAPLIGNVDKLGIKSNIELQDTEKEKIKDYLENKYLTVDFMQDSIVANNYVTFNNNAVVEISVDFKFPFRAVIYENFRSEGYVEVWESDLTWFLGQWVLKQRVNIGQS